ncbi:MAG: tRNA (adenosine(37)-N6)-dimethylallyltransferase MiaA [Clostridia bacterium]|nr:tRNA (adenosine(37)-N6)-dimethylallyltransferase MiaA [Clostridia bacterium]
MPKVLVVCGATASGKTALAVECAKKLNTEIVSADSLLVYRGLNIGTAKPSIDEMQGIKHHLIDVASPLDNFSVSDYEKLALPIVESLLDAGKTPIICGGTGFYINSLLYKSQFGNVGANEEVRLRYEKILEEKGCEYLHELLKNVDAESAEKLHPNDTKRVIRALEIFEITGKKKSQQQDAPIPRFDFICVSIDYPREELYARIEKRVDIMFEQGLKEEVEELTNSGVCSDCQCMQGIGYKEVAEGLQNGCSEEEIKELIKKNTRNYAKRQITFFKRAQNHHVLSPENATVETVLSLLNN